jgi:hypothetical protein
MTLSIFIFYVICLFVDGERARSLPGAFWFCKTKTEDWLQGVAVDDRGLLRSVVEVRAATHTHTHTHTHARTHTHTHTHAHTQVRAATSREEERKVDTKVSRVMKQLHAALARKQVWSLGFRA